jgi:hypothetical protein
MVEPKPKVIEQEAPAPSQELFLPEDPVIRNLAIQKLNGQNGAVNVPARITNNESTAGQKAPTLGALLEGLLRQFLRQMNENTRSRANSRRSRGWSD